MDFAGRVALVTGGGGGIGGAIAAELARRGGKVAVGDLDIARAQATAERINRETQRDDAIAIKLDVTCLDDFVAARDTIEGALGTLDILASNAGVGHTQQLGEISIDAFRWVYDVNVNATVRALHTFLPGMKARGTPAHVLITCSITSLRPFAAQSAYTSSKAALLSLAMALELELKGTAIDVSALCPGIVATQLGENAKAAKPDVLKIAADAEDTPSPLAQGMKPDAVGRAAVDAMAAKQFYVFPTTDYRDVVAAEQRVVLEAMTRQAQPGYTEPAIFLTSIR